MYILKRKQIIPISVEKAWDFFSSPENLKNITPEHMGFNIITESEKRKMFAGMIIGYIIKPVLGIPVKWITEITHVMEPEYFIDEQRFGPYKFWHHMHEFSKTDNGTEMRDTVYYILPFGFIGRILHSLFIRRKLEKIFDFRGKILSEIFAVEK